MKIYEIADGFQGSEGKVSMSADDFQLLESINDGLDNPVDLSEEAGVEEEPNLFMVPAPLLTKIANQARWGQDEPKMVQTAGPTGPAADRDRPRGRRPRATGQKAETGETNVEETKSRVAVDGKEDTEGGPTITPTQKSAGRKPSRRS